MNPESKPASRKKIIRVITNIIVFGFLLLMLFSPSAKGWFLARIISIGFFRPSPDANIENAADLVLNLKTADGNIISTDQFMGKTVFVNFWASWCPPCRAEMSSLNDLYNELKNDPTIVFVFISEDENQEKATTYLSENNYLLPLYTLTSPAPRTGYSGTLPTTLVINPQGKMVYRHEQMADYNTSSFKEYLRNLKDNRTSFFKKSK